MAGYAHSELPEVKKDCGICHISHGMKSLGLLKMPIIELCSGCHPLSKSNDHAVDVAPSMPVEKLPLSKEGKITCITCHEPHGRGGFEKMLRVKPEELCGKCHKM